MKPSILIVDDDASIREALAERLGARGFRVTTASDGHAAIERARDAHDVVLLDLQLPGLDGLGVLRRLREEGIESTVVVITAYGTVERAVEAMRAGAWDFLEKPFDPALVEETIRRALERQGLVRANRALRAQGKLGGLVSADPRFEAVVAVAKKAAASASTVLLLGESGTGKEVMARSIHAWSPRAEGPFVVVNCVALSEGLLESELFGHEKGAFTGAHARKLGRLELAHGGTLFLDEVGDLPAPFQAKLLRVLQERSFERVGGTKTLSVDVRVLAATNRDLSKLVEEGGFREDLFYRLNVIALELPPLRERPADVPAFCDAFVGDLCREVGRPALAVSADALERLCAYRWPGNVRELRNVLERAVVLCEGDAIEVHDLPEDVAGASGAATGDGYHAQVDTFRRETLRAALAQHDGNQTRAAKSLGLARTYLARLVKKHGL